MNREKSLELLIRSGDILNGLGILRAAHIYGNEITREQFIELIKRNYLIEDLKDWMYPKLDESWNFMIEWINESKIDLGSNEKIIKYKDPDWCFDI